MFGVLLESQATRARRTGGAALSLATHSALVLGAITLTADHRVRGTDPISSTRPPLEWVSPTRLPERGSGKTTSGQVPSPRRVFVAPRPLVFTFDTILRRPMVDYNPAGPDAVIGSDFCRRSTDCAVVASGPVGAGEAITDSASGRDMAARIIGSPMRPRYPEGLRTAGLAGRVVVQFIIDSTGRVEVASIRVLESTHALFAAAVLEVLPRYRFVAAEANGRQTRMTVQMPFEFTLDRR